MTDIRTLPVTAELIDYVVDHGSWPVDEVLADLQAETLGLGAAAGMQIGADQGQLLTLLTRIAGARRAVEVGTFTGLLVAVHRPGLAEDGRLLCCDVSEEWTALARRAWDARARRPYRLRLAPALETLQALPPTCRSTWRSSAPTSPATSPTGTELVPRVRPGGLLLADNVLWSGRITDEPGDDANLAALRAFNDRVAGDARSRGRHPSGVRRAHDRGKR